MVFSQPMKNGFTSSATSQRMDLAPDGQGWRRRWTEHGGRRRQRSVAGSASPNLVDGGSDAQWSEVVTTHMVEALKETAPDDRICVARPSGGRI